MLRQAWCDGRRIRNKTLANLSKLPPELVDGFHTVLKCGLAVQDHPDLLRVERCWAHGHVPAVVPDSELGIARRLFPDTADCSLGVLLDRLLAHQCWIETSLRLRDTVSFEVNGIFACG